ncbi:MAG: hypothetical protein HDKAJFGB_03996 [Anaerolineae bacterium]|nr:hypothetical protein [Anaerolineae bacterium]
MPADEELLDKVCELKSMIVSMCTGGYNDFQEKRFRVLREHLLAYDWIKEKMPEVARRYSSKVEVYRFMKAQSETYQGRAGYLDEAFRPLIQILEGKASAPNDEHVSRTISSIDWDRVQKDWTKALELRDSDPEGAIRQGRTLLETVCKHILEEAGVPFREKDDLPQLYRSVADLLQLSPSRQTEEIFKQVMGGCFSVVQGLGAIRSKHSDAHGKGLSLPPPESRHAELAVNLAGTMASFLIKCWSEGKESS